MTCETCKFYAAKGEFEGSGVCHRYPPDVNGRHPSVSPSDWCGEYAVDSHVFRKTQSDGSTARLFKKEHFQ